MPTLRRHLHNYRARQRKLMLDDLEGLFLERTVQVLQRLKLGAFEIDRTGYIPQLLSPRSYDVETRGVNVRGHALPRWRTIRIG